MNELLITNERLISYIVGCVLILMICVLARVKNKNKNKYNGRY